MVLIIALLAWGQPEYVQVRWTVMGEVLECVLEPAGSRPAGLHTGRRVGMVGGLVAGILGAVLPGPNVGTVIGACLGAFAGSLIGDLWAGRVLLMHLARAPRCDAVVRRCVPLFSSSRILP